MARVVHKGIEWFGYDTTKTLCDRIVKDEEAVPENKDVTCKRCLKQIKKNEGKK